MLPVWLSAWSAQRGSNNRNNIPNILHFISDGFFLVTQSKHYLFNLFRFFSSIFLLCRAKSQTGEEESRSSDGRAMWKGEGDKASADGKEDFSERKFIIVQIESISCLIVNKAKRRWLISRQYVKKHTFSVEI